MLRTRFSKQFRQLRSQIKKIAWLALFFYFAGSGREGDGEWGTAPLLFVSFAIELLVGRSFQVGRRPVVVMNTSPPDYLIKVEKNRESEDNQN